MSEQATVTVTHDSDTVVFQVTANTRNARAMRAVIVRRLSDYMRESDIQSEQMSVADFAFYLLSAAARE